MSAANNSMSAAKKILIIEDDPSTKFRKNVVWQHPLPRNRYSRPAVAREKMAKLVRGGKRI